MKTMKLFGMVAVMVGVFAARGEVLQWADGAVVDVGCQGAGDNNYNNDAQIMYFLGDGVIHGTYTPAANNPWSWAIWRNYLITNGTVVVDATDIKAKLPNDHAPLFQRGMDLGEHGSLVISNSAIVAFGGLQTGEYFYVNIPRVSSVTADGTPQTVGIQLNCCTVKGFPRSGVNVWLRNTDVRLAIAGPDFPAVYGTTFNNAKTYFFDDAFIPAGATLTGGSSCELYLSAYTLGDGADFLQVSEDHVHPWSADYGEFPTCTHDVNVGFKLVLQSTCGCSFTKTVTGTTGNSTVWLPGGLTHTFAKLAGEVRFDTYSTDSVPTNRVNAVAAGTRLYVCGDRSVLLLAGGLEPAVAQGAGGTWYVFPDAKGQYDFTGIDIRQLSAFVILPVNASFEQAAALGPVKTTPAVGTTLAATLDKDHAPAFVGGEGTIRLSESVCNRAALWLDPSVASTCYTIGEATPDYVKAKSTVDVDSLTKTYNTCYLIEAMADVRAYQTSWFLRHTRNYGGILGGSRTSFENLPSVFPYRVTDGGPNGLAYMSCIDGGAKRRIQTSRGTLDPTSTDEPTMNTLTTTKYVIMVFGSQGGGGRALIGLGDSALTRVAATKESPIAPAGSSVRAWVDGVSVDPTTTGLSGGWQVISLDITGHNVNALGWAAGDYQLSGGQNYGETLIFTEDLTDAERVSVERYLARKWGIAGYAPSTTAVTEHPGKAHLYGTNGTVEVASGHVQVSGRFSGAITVAADAVLDVTGTYEPSIPTEGLVGWFDPDCAGCLTTETEDGATNIYGFYPHGKTAATMTVGDYFFYGVGSRRPFAVKSARGFGPERTWIDFDHPAGHAPSISDGNTLRFKQWTANGISDSSFTGSGSDRQLDVRTVVFVNDSFRGGGDPLRQNVSSGGDWGSRGKASASKAIWNDAGTKVKNGTTRLNGVAVNGTTTGYTGEAEVLSVVTTDSVKLGNFGHYENSEKCSGWAEMMGESLLYSTALTTEQVKTIEDYLLFKWVGIAPDGFGDFSGATVSGAGRVRASSAAALPKFAAGFTGQVDLDVDTLVYSFDPASAPAVSPLDVGAGTLALPATVQVTVQFEGKPASGSYQLVKGTLAAGTTFTLTTTGTPGSSSTTLHVEDDGLWLNIAPSGTVLLVR